MEIEENDIIENKDDELINKAYKFLGNLDGKMNIIEGKNQNILQMLLDRYKNNQALNLSEKKLLQDYYLDRKSTVDVAMKSLNSSYNLISDLIKLYSKKFGKKPKDIPFHQEQLALNNNKQLDYLAKLPLLDTNKRTRYKQTPEYYIAQFETFHLHFLDNLFEKFRAINKGISRNDQYLISAYPNTYYRFRDPFQSETIFYQINNIAKNEMNDLCITIIYHTPDGRDIAYKTYFLVVDQRDQTTAIYFSNISLRTVYDKQNQLIEFIIKKVNMSFDHIHCILNQQGNFIFVNINQNDTSVNNNNNQGGQDGPWKSTISTRFSWRKE